MLDAASPPNSAGIPPARRAARLEPVDRCGDLGPGLDVEGLDHAVLDDPHEPPACRRHPSRCAAWSGRWDVTSPTARGRWSGTWTVPRTRPSWPGRVKRWSMVSRADRRACATGDFFPARPCCRSAPCSERGRVERLRLTRLRRPASPPIWRSFSSGPARDEDRLVGNTVVLQDLELYKLGRLTWDCPAFVEHRGLNGAVLLTPPQGVLVVHDA